MAKLTKAQINQADDRKVEEVAVPEWGGEVDLQVMSGTDLDKFEAILQDPEKQKDGGVRARLVALCMVDENFKRIYSDAEVYELGKKNGAVLTRLFRKCIEMNKISEAEVEDEVENFGDAQEEPSTSA